MATRTPVINTALELEPWSTSGGSVVIPADRQRTVALSDTSAAKARTSAKRVSDANLITYSAAVGGGTGRSPGVGNPYYRSEAGGRQWTRDQVDGWLDAILTDPSLVVTSEVIGFINRFGEATTAPGFRVPDRIRADGLVEQVPFNGIQKSPNDNNLFYLSAFWVLFKKNGSTDLFVANRSKIESIYNGVDHNTENGCAYIVDQNVGEFASSQFYGFFDNMYHSGYSTFGISLQFRVCRQLAEIELALGNTAGAQVWVDRANTLKSFFNSSAAGLWDETYGMYRTASIKGSAVHDIWSNALAVAEGLADNTKAVLVSQKLNATRDQWLHNGGTRHIGELDEFIRGVQCWPFYVQGGRSGADSGRITDNPALAGTEAPYGEYQEGGYWYTITRSVCSALALTNVENARVMMAQALYYANLILPEQDNVECVSKNGLFRCTQYYDSALAISGAIVGGGTDPQIEVATLAAPFSVEENAVLSDGTPAIGYDSNWLTSTGDSAYSGNAGRYTNTPLALASLSFTSTQTSYFKLSTPTNPDLGILEISIDNGAWVEASQYNATATRKRIFQSAALAAGTHAVQIRKKNDGAKFVVLDVFAAEYSLDDTGGGTPPPDEGTLHPAAQPGYYATFNYLEGVNTNANNEVLSWADPHGSNLILNANADRTVPITIVTGRGIRLNGQWFTLNILGGGFGGYVGAEPRTMYVQYEDLATGTFVSSIAGQSILVEPSSTQDSIFRRWFVIQERTKFVSGGPYLAGFNGDVNSNDAPDNQPKVAITDYDGTTARLFRDGVLKNSAALSLNTAGPFLVGKDLQDKTDDNLSAMNGYVKRVLLFRGVHSDTVRQQVLDWIAQNP